MTERRRWDNSGNDVSGTVIGPSIQANAISGGVHYHRAPGEAMPIPRQLPPPPAFFTNRSGELAAMDDILGRAPALVVLSGPGGVGKTALALQWIHRQADVFPDGQLYVDLAGYGGGGPVLPGTALGLFLRALGVPPEAVPFDVAEQAALFRSLTATRSVALLLDNAHSAAQVRALLPGSRTSAVIVTSRSRLIGLLPDGARLLEVGPLPPPDAITFLMRVVGEDRITGEQEHAEHLVRMCAGLPIAVCVAAARLAARPRLSVERMATELADERNRLAGLSASGGPSVQAAFDLSYRSLAPPVATLYRRLGLHPGPDFGSGVAAVLVADRPRDALDRLVEDNLLEEIADDRYRFHDLLRLHARQRTTLDDTSRERNKVLRHIIEWYLSTAMSADLAVTPYRRRPLVYEFGQLPRASLCFKDRHTALTWLDAERTNLVVAGQAAMDRQWPDLAWHLSDVMWPLLLYRKSYRDRLDIDRRGVAAARAWGNRWAEAEMLKRLGRVSTVLGQHEEAENQLRSAVDLFTAQNDPVGVSGAQEYLALLHLAEGRRAAATELFEHVLRRYREIGTERNVGLTLVNLGLMLPQQNRAAEAVQLLVEAHGIFQRLDEEDPFNAARVLVALAGAYRHLGELDQARTWAVRALRAMVELGSDFGQAEAHEVLAEVAVDAGDHAAAVSHLALAADIFSAAASARATAVRARLRQLGGE